MSCLFKVRIAIGAPSFHRVGTIPATILSGFLHSEISCRDDEEEVCVSVYPEGESAYRELELQVVERERENIMSFDTVYSAPFNISSSQMRFWAGVCACVSGGGEPVRRREGNFSL